jgi:hypothetical protein
MLIIYIIGIIVLFQLYKISFQHNVITENNGNKEIEKFQNIQDNTQNIVSFNKKNIQYDNEQCINIEDYSICNNTETPTILTKNNHHYPRARPKLFTTSTINNILYNNNFLSKYKNKLPQEINYKDIGITFMNILAKSTNFVLPNISNQELYQIGVLIYKYEINNEMPENVNNPLSQSIHYILDSNVIPSRLIEVGEKSKKKDSIKKHIIGLKYNSLIEDSKIESQSDNRLGGSHNIYMKMDKFRPKQRPENFNSLWTFY